MKLAEALQERADLQTKITRIERRMTRNALVQEGDTPAEPVETLKKELDSVIERLTDLVTAINMTNSLTTVEGKTLTRLIAEKDSLDKAINACKEAVGAAENAAFRARGSEIKIQSTISVPEWQKKVDRMCAERRRLDQLLQRTNWEVDLIE